ncbi:MAG: hypothetical protein KAW84_03275 [Thermoplasmata archaeon]|nr:hypothetical protein [Thermoplasmata archaeon]
MQIGCGQTVKTIKGNRYIYFWWYGSTNGRSFQKHTCVGREDNPEAREKARRMILDYYVRARESLNATIRALRGRS